MRARSRSLIRDAAYAKRAKVVVVNNVIGPGMGVQAQVMTRAGKLNDRINDDIEAAWERWCQADACHVGGELHFADIERLAMGQVFEAGEVFIRKHYRRMGRSQVPMALEIIEPERIADEFQPSAVAQGAKVRMGVESDEYHRPIAYWIRTRHPGEIRLTAGETEKLERVPAEQIIHLRVIDRWPQTRGEPWLHAAMRKLNDMDGYSEAEIIAARGAASYMGIIETPEPELQGTEDYQASEFELSPGVIERLAPGEKFVGYEPNRPNSNMDPFMRLMLREVAAGVGVSYESLSRDYSQSNYSSSRLALIDDRDLWRTLQQWFIRSFRRPLHEEWLQQAVLSRAVAVSAIDYAANQEKYSAVQFKPRGWSWVDPTKEVNAYKEAVKAGFTTVSDVIATTGGGRDLEDVLKDRRRELDMMAEAGLTFDTDPGVASSAGPQASPQDDQTDEEDERPARIVPFANGR